MIAQTGSLQAFAKGAPKGAEGLKAPPRLTFRTQSRFEGGLKNLHESASRVQGSGFRVQGLGFRV